MLLDGLVKGSLVNLEIVTEEEKYEIISVVSGSAHNSILIENVRADKRILSLGKKEFENAVYNLYADDPEGNRVGWYNVSVKPIEYNNHCYRGIYTKTFNSNSSLSDRRSSFRLKLVDVTGQVETKDGVLKEVSLYDISNNGISFLCEDDDYLNKKLTIHIEDMVNDENYKINVDCTCVREATEDGKMLFGCRIGEVEQSYLVYLFEKKLSEKRPASGTTEVAV